MSETLQKLNIYADDQLGKATENILRRVITGEGAESLPNDIGLQGLAIKHAPTPARIKSDVNKLKMAYMIVNGKKEKVPATTRNIAEIIQQRIRAIGWTGRTLLYDWAEAKVSRVAIIQNKHDEHQIEINTSGNVQKAKFTSTSPGLLRLNKKHQIVKKAIEGTRTDCIDYLKQLIQSDIKKIIKR